MSDLLRLTDICPPPQQSRGRGTIELPFARLSCSRVQFVHSLAATVCLLLHEWGSCRSKQFAMRGCERQDERTNGHIRKQYIWICYGWNCDHKRYPSVTIFKGGGPLELRIPIIWILHSPGGWTEWKQNSILSSLHWLNTLKTGTPIEDVDSILKLLRGVSHPEIQIVR